MLIPKNFSKKGRMMQIKVTQTLPSEILMYTHTVLECFSIQNFYVEEYTITPFPEQWFSTSILRNTSKY